MDHHPFAEPLRDLAQIPSWHQFVVTRGRVRKTRLIPMVWIDYEAWRQHDFAYWLGGTWEHRLLADQGYLAQALAGVNKWNWFAQLWVWASYIDLRLSGHRFFSKERRRWGHFLRELNAYRAAQLRLERGE